MFKRIVVIDFRARGSTLIITNSNHGYLVKKLGYLLQEVTFGILLYAGTVSGRKGLKTLTFMAGVDGFVAVTESRVFKVGGAFFLIGKGAMVVYHLVVYHSIDIVI